MKDPLKESLERELEALSERANQDSAVPRAEQMETLTRFAALIELRDKLRRKRTNWWPALVFLGTLAAVSVLLFARVRVTEIELDASVASLNFDLATEQLLTGELQVASLGVSGLANVQMPELPGPSKAVSLPGSAVNALLLSSAAVRNRTGSVTLAPVPLPAGTRIELSRSDVPRQYRLSLAPSGVELKAAVEGPLVVTLAGSPARKLEFAVPRLVTLRGRPEELSLDLTFLNLPQAPFSPLLAVRNLSFLRIDEFPDAGRTMVRRLSTIISGTLYFDSLNGRERHLRPGEELSFQECEGWIRTLEVADRSVGLKFHGDVSGMTTGTGEGRRSLMPTYLEWLQARHTLSLFWATSLYLFAVIAGALRWWGVRI